MEDRPKDFAVHLGGCRNVFNNPSSRGIGMPPMGLSCGGPPAGARPKAVSKAKATSAKSLDLPVPGAPDTSTLRERASSFNTCLQFSLTITEPTHVREVDIANYGSISSPLCIQTTQ